MFALYEKDGGLTAKVLLLPLIEKLLGEKRVYTTLPSTGKVALYERENSYIMHLCYANIIARGKTEVVEDIVTLSSVKVSVKFDKPAKVLLQPQGEEIDFTYEDGRVCFELKDFNCHAAIEFVK